MVEKIKLITTDNVVILGDHYRSESANENPGISLFHMMPSTKESYKSLAEKLQQAGIGVVAIDLRGHGESEGGPDGYNNFTEEEHQKSIEDLKTAIEYQKNEGHHPLFILGASIGANLCLKFIAESDMVKKAILLSPGVNYMGIEAISLAKGVSSSKEIYIIAAKDDIREFGSADKEAEQIFDALSCKKKIKLFDTGGHGTDILVSNPEVVEELITWLGE
ncbi:MAG: alpha/beta fold hydrolase [Nanoarchaeota archaeon]|nr:alpha/beta fold hydrolase [Nanoarchaeota archaeon]